MHRHYHKGDRCTLSIKEPRLSAIGGLLKRMSQRSPEFTTRQTLHQLADLCLCRTYHSEQVQEFVSLWTTVIEEAVSVKREKKARGMDEFQRFEQLFDLKSSISELQDSLDAAWQDNDQLQKQHQRDVKRLRGKIKHLEQQLQESKDHNNVAEQKSLDLEFNIEHIFRPKIIHLEQKLKESQDRNNITQGRLSATRTKFEELQTQTTSDWIARNRLEIENKSLKTQLTKAQKKLDEHTFIKDKNQDFHDQIKSFEIKVKQYKVMLEDSTRKASESEEKAAAERGAKEAMESRLKAQLTEREDEIVRFKNHQEELEQTITETQASIDTCWWHRLWTWKERFWKRSKSGSWIRIGDGTNEDIGLQTYA